MSVTLRKMPNVTSARYPDGHLCNLLVNLNAEKSAIIHDPDRGSVKRAISLEYCCVFSQGYVVFTRTVIEHRLSVLRQLLTNCLNFSLQRASESAMTAA